MTKCKGSADEPRRGSAATKAAAYSMAAGAAMSAPTAEAAIRYLPNQNIDILLGQTQPLSIDDDQYADINLKNYVLEGVYYQGATVNFFPGTVIGFEETNAGPNNTTIDYVSRLSEGFLIDANSAGPDFKGLMAWGNNTPNAEFNQVTGAFLGVAFPIGGNTQQEIHYGWLRVDIDNAAGTFRVVDWAYQLEPGVGIMAGEITASDYDVDGDVDVADALEGQRLGEDISAGSAWDTEFGIGDAPEVPAIGAVPEPGTLGLLAAGSLGLSALRRTRRRRV